MTDLTRHDDVYVLNIGDTENRFSLDWLQQINTHLDSVVADPAPLVTTGVGKFYSNGLDLDWLLENRDRWDEYVGQVHALLARVLTLPVPTLAAVNGHAFGAGAMFSMAHDWRLMRADRGFFCFPEVDIKIPFTPGMAALIQAKLAPQTALLAMSTGQRFDAATAVRVGLIEGAAEADDLATTGIGRLAPLAGKDAATLEAIKQVMYAGAVTALGGS